VFLAVFFVFFVFLAFFFYFVSALYNPILFFCCIVLLFYAVRKIGYLCVWLFVCPHADVILNANQACIALFEVYALGHDCPLQSPRGRDDIKKNSGRERDDDHVIVLVR